MTAVLNIDFVSDVSCPWCVVGLGELDLALSRLAGSVEATIRFQPFELNPALPAGGQDIREHLAEKYGSTAEQLAQVSEQLRRRGATVGFDFRFERRLRIYNTLDAHRLLYWTEGEPAKQAALKRALFRAYFTDGTDVSDHAALESIVAGVGLDAQQARAVLEGDRYAVEVRERERYYQERGIQAVPSVIIAGRHLIQGGQPSDVFERTLRQLAAGQGAGIR